MARPRLVSDERILAATRECLVAHGPGVSTGVIAAQLGLSQAALFKRFGTKERLLQAALVDDPARVLAGLAGEPDDRPIEAQLAALTLALLDHFEAMLPRLLLWRATGHGGPDFDAGQDAFPLRARKALATWFRRARALGLIGDVDPALAADVLLGAAQLRPLMRHVGGGARHRTGQRRFANDLARTLLTGLAPPDARPRRGVRSPP